MPNGIGNVVDNDSDQRRFRGYRSLRRSRRDSSADFEAVSRESCSRLAVCANGEMGPSRSQVSAEVLRLLEAGPLLGLRANSLFEAEIAMELVTQSEEDLQASVFCWRLSDGELNDPLYRG